ncbi:MAG: RNA polymerase sigma factor [Anaerolineae bacterium]|jgi:RNA polymerase sigma-70 factor (ECF subfamily)|uniref:RNA polymerase sigma factor n=1 Tax=Candidatus Flexifilum breve TaxID=3140694 RepID=UPI001ACA95E6|nr:RNA polymerase sigma factor [Chloroflexota bacterium]MBK9750528.1 RNA polymerase sigma factor [Chloroflexota bacterium]MBN8634301.1 RNA polymerase sigma factor [Anaerolineae bacterium]
MIPEEVESSMRRALRGDQSGYAALYELFAPGIYRLCYSLLFNREDAEDVTQESFVYAFRNLQRYDAKLSSFKTWLYTIAICRCRNMYRKSQVPTCDLAPFLNNGLPAPRSETPEAALAQQSAREAVSRALASLTPRLREAVVLRYGHGLTYREIAEVMDCPQKTAESRVRLAHEALRGSLQAVGQGLLDELLSF